MVLERIWTVLRENDAQDTALYESLWSEIQVMLKESYLRGYDKGQIDGCKRCSEEELTFVNDSC